MDSGFGQFCPIALASEVLTQKWMLLVLREMNAGASRFNDIRRGVPRMSATLLKQRLDQLVSAGLVVRKPLPGGATDRYLLTEAGRETKLVLKSVGEWGQRWARDINPEDLDPGWLVWSMHRRLDLSEMPAGRTVMEIVFADAPKNQRLFWLVCHEDKVEVCLKPTGFDVDLRVITEVRTLAEVWRGLRPLRPALSRGAIRLEGTAALRRAFPRWLQLSLFAKIKRAT